MPPLRRRSTRARSAARYELSPLGDATMPASRAGSSICSARRTAGERPFGPCSGPMRLPSVRHSPVPRDFELPVALQLRLQPGRHEIFRCARTTVKSRFAFCSAERSFTNRTMPGLQVAQIPWEKEADFRLAGRDLAGLMDRYYPNTAWLCVRKDVFDRLTRVSEPERPPDLGASVWSAARGPRSRPRHEPSPRRPHRRRRPVRGVHSVPVPAFGEELPALDVRRPLSRRVLSRYGRRRGVEPANRVPHPRETAETTIEVAVRFLHSPIDESSDTRIASVPRKRQQHCDPVRSCANWRQGLLLVAGGRGADFHAGQRYRLSEIAEPAARSAFSFPGRRRSGASLRSGRGGRRHPGPRAAADRRWPSRSPHAWPPTGFFD